MQMWDDPIFVEKMEKYTNAKERLFDILEDFGLGYVLLEDVLLKQTELDLYSSSKFNWTSNTGVITESPTSAKADDQEFSQITTDSIVSH